MGLLWASLGSRWNRKSWPRRKLHRPNMPKSTCQLLPEDAKVCRSNWSMVTFATSSWYWHGSASSCCVWASPVPRASYRSCATTPWKMRRSEVLESAWRRASTTSLGIVLVPYCHRWLLGSGAGMVVEVELYFGGSSHFSLWDIVNTLW